MTLVLCLVPIVALFAGSFIASKTKSEIRYGRRTLIWLATIASLAPLFVTFSVSIAFVIAAVALIVASRLQDTLVLQFAAIACASVEPLTSTHHILLTVWGLANGSLLPRKKLFIAAGVFLFICVANNLVL